MFYHDIYNASDQNYLNLNEKPILSIKTYKQLSVTILENDLRLLKTKFMLNMSGLIKLILKNVSNLELEFNRFNFYF